MMQDRAGGGHDPAALDAFFADRKGTWWDEFFADQSRAVPFFTDRPDENLADWCASGLVKRGRVLELGCGYGRNAVYLANLGCVVDAVDFSAAAVGWARHQAERAGVAVSFQCCLIFDAVVPAGAYDLVYDSGCFHHLPPHRRASYVALVERALDDGHEKLSRDGLVAARWRT